MTPKPMYHALKALIKGKWWTVAEAKVGRRGRAGFRGFYGEYKVVVVLDGKKLTGAFAFDKDTKGAVKVELK